MIAGIGVGMIDDWSFVVGSLESGELISPNEARSAIYEERYHEYLELGRVTTSLTHRLARSQS